MMINRLIVIIFRHQLLSISSVSNRKQRARALRRPFHPFIDKRIRKAESQPNELQRYQTNRFTFNLYDGEHVFHLLLLLLVGSFWLDTQLTHIAPQDETVTEIRNNNNEMVLVLVTNQRNYSSNAAIRHRKNKYRMCWMGRPVNRFFFLRLMFALRLFTSRTVGQRLLWKNQRARD